MGSADGDRDGVVAADEGVSFEEGGTSEWSGVKARLAYTMALFNILMMWDGLPADENNILHISMAQFVL